MFSYKTKVRINLTKLVEVAEELKQAYEKIDPEHKKDNTSRRSAFNQWNNTQHFLQRLLQNEGKKNIPILKKYPDNSVLIEVEGAAKGNTSRIYFTPSVTSLCKQVRSAYQPIDDSKVFVYMDIKAAEFALRCVQAGETEALQKYQAGDDIYMHYAYIFPEGTPRATIKKCLIANMYGQTAYNLAKDLGVSETQAQRMLDNVAASTPKLTMLKRSIITKCRLSGAYLSPDGFNQEMLLPVANYTEETFNPNMAWSAYTQSALGFIFQKLSNKYLNHQKNVEATFLTIFDSVVAEIDPANLGRFAEFVTSSISPLLPDKFTTGKTIYQAMYGND